MLTRSEAGARGARPGRPPSPGPYPGKRLFDLALLGLAAVPAALAASLAALAIWLEDGPPVLFRQVRAGHQGRPFVLLKLRTMRKTTHLNGTFPDPARLTRVGRVLRRTSLDELPQLINVARGEMSLIGPRPTLLSQLPRYDARQRRRLAVLPGLTGLAQVHGRNKLSWPERIEWDLRYVAHQTFRLDLAVLAATARALVSGDGVTGHPRCDPIAHPTDGGHQMPPGNVRVRLARPDIGAAEIEAVSEVLTSGVLTSGQQNAAFEREFAARHGAAHGVTFASGTSALAAMLLAEGVGPGDEVIVPAMTFISTATSVCHVGATPVFADIYPRSFNLDPAQIPALVTPRTRAVVAVHYGGQPGDLAAMLKACADEGLVLLEDAAEAAGAEYQGQPVGTIGAAAMFSFTPTKNITTGEGGLVLTGSADTARRLRLLRNHGQRARYEHTVLGYNWRLTEMQAAMGRVQLRKLGEILARKRANAAWLDRRLARVPGLTPPHRVPYGSHTYMLYTCLIETGRDAVLAHLLDRGIEARIYFPPVHRQPVFAGRTASLPVTDAVAGRMLSIPMHSLLEPDELTLIADTLEEGVREARESR